VRLRRWQPRPARAGAVAPGIRGGRASRSSEPVPSLGGSAAYGRTRPISCRPPGSAARGRGLHHRKPRSDPPSDPSGGPGEDGAWRSSNPAVWSAIFSGQKRGSLSPFLTGARRSSAARSPRSSGARVRRPLLRHSWPTLRRTIHQSNRCGPIRRRPRENRQQPAVPPALEWARRSVWSRNPPA